MFGLGVPEMLVILVIIFIIFGAGKLPEIGTALGKGIQSFKRAIHAPGETDTARGAEKNSVAPDHDQRR